MRECSKCGRQMPMENRPGPKRKMCQDCSPSRPRRKSDGVVEVAVSPVMSAAPGSVFEATRAELHAAGTANSALGMTALALAERIDSGEEKGAGLASLAKQFESVMRSCGPKAEQADDPLQRLLNRDELSQRRERRSS